MKIIDPIVACERIKAATDIRFVCFDRMETEEEIGFLQHIKRYDTTEIMNLAHAKEKASEKFKWTPLEVVAFETVKDLARPLRVIE